MNDQKVRQAIEAALKKFPSEPLAEAASHLLGVLGYASKKRLPLKPNTLANFLATFSQGRAVNNRYALPGEWKTVDFLFQLTDDEVRAAGNRQFEFESKGAYNGAVINSYLFFALELKGDHYSRTALAGITREVNKLFDMPTLILFRYGETLTLAVINRRLHKREEGKDVLEKVTLIKDIRCTNTHRAHIEILLDLSLGALHDEYGFTSFVELHAAWERTLDTSALNKRFFQDLANWYFWALQHVRFPQGAGKDADVRNAISVIRLITRLIFVWFIKERGLVSEVLFRRREVEGLLKSFDPEESTYYKAILQNLFFATLNTEMDVIGKPSQRTFRKRTNQKGGRDQHYMVHNVYRYEDQFKDSKAALKLFAETPFLNGGLFECLDKRTGTSDRPVDVRIDGFSDRNDNPVSVPNFLFFGPEQEVDLNDVYGTKNKRYKALGLVSILSRYKFTVNENTPVEEEVALDPELLGRVFENLLASYNPETSTTARKQTGSFYTPREIVNYMVDEALIAYLESSLAVIAGTTASGGKVLNELLALGTGPGDLALSAQEVPVRWKVAPDKGSAEDINQRLRHLLAYNDEPHKFSPAEVRHLIQIIDRMRILDPACGSGAFPMGVLHKLVFLLGRLDPGNKQWKARQIERVDALQRTAQSIPDATFRERALADLEAQKASIEEAFERNELDYGRKLFLIENCIFGVDIQPVAVQIAKLRFFISLIVDQKIDDERENRGVRPLPNLETRFVAANTLVGIERPAQAMLRNPDIDEKERELKSVRERYFSARTPATKEKYRKEDERLRKELAELFRTDGFSSRTAKQLASWNPYDQNAFADFFDPEWIFGITDGFGITIGNPPYVRADSGEAHLALRKWLEESHQYQTLWEKWDLFIPFIEKGYQLLKPGGVTTMIVSDAYCHSKYAQKSQNWFLKNSRILRLEFFSRIQIFEAAVHNITYFFQKAEGSGNYPLRRVHDPEFGAIRLLPSDEQSKLTHRVFFPGDQQTQVISLPTIPLEIICYISKGMVVHANERTVQGSFELSDLVSDMQDKRHPRRFLEGKHLGRWLPATHKWLEWGTQRAPSQFSRPTFQELYEVPEKILIHRTGGEGLRSCYDTHQTLCNHTVMVCLPWHLLHGVRNNSLKKAARYRGEKPQRPDLPKREELEASSRRFALKFLLGVMNSATARDFLRANRRSNTDLYPEDWKKLPVPDVPPAQQKSIVALVDKILAVRRANPNADIAALESDLDVRVGSLYGETQADIGATQKSARSSLRRAEPASPSS